MTSLVVKIETMDEFKARAVKSMKDAQKGKAKPYHGISFPTYADMHETLAPPRLEIIRALAGQAHSQFAKSRAGLGATCKPCIET